MLEWETLGRNESPADNLSMNRRVTHCPNGHIYSNYPSETTAFTSKGARICKICRRARDSVRRARETALKRQIRGPKKNGPDPVEPNLRFWPKVEIRDVNDCWPWKASVKEKGYGCFWDGSKHTQAHRFALEQTLGRKLTTKEHARHTCDNPPCCNPNHLVVGSAKDNHTDKIQRKRHHNQLKTRCPRGHKYDGVVHRKDGGIRRYCKKCKSESYKRNKL